MNATLRSLLLALACLVPFTGPGRLHGQVPDRLGHQGTVSVNGTPFTGTGRFKFAVVDASGSESYWSNDGSSRRGSEPGRHLELPVEAGVYAVALGDPSIPGQVALTSAAFTHPEVFLRVWFSDGAHGFQLLTPDEPFQPGAYAMLAARVAPGGVTAEALAPGAVTAPSLAPGAALENLLASQSAGGAGGVQFALSPNLPAYTSAGLVPVGSLPIQGEVWSAPVFDVPPARSAPTLHWTGTEVLVLGGTLNASPFPIVNPGYRLNPRTGACLPLPASNAPSLPIVPGTAEPGDWVSAWTGEALLVLNTRTRVGRTCRLTDTTWRALPASNAPSPRSGASALWTGTEWILWGGRQGNGDSLGDGVRFRPASGEWVPIRTATVPRARHGHRTVWTGDRMLVLGGQSTSANANTALHDVWSYDPAADTWQPLSAGTEVRMDTPGLEAVVWTGSELVAFGLSALGTSTNFAAGARFDPSTGQWRPLPGLSALAGLTGASTVWTGTEIVRWGGTRARLFPESPSRSVESRGFAWSPAANTWRELPDADAPSPRTTHAAVWTGTEMVVWGGASSSVTSLTELGDGGRYQPGANRWLPLQPPPLHRLNPTVVWTGTELLVWGGVPSAVGRYAVATGARYQPSTGRWSPLSNRNAPSPRVRHTAVWTGRELWIWGGFASSPDTTQGRASSGLNTGARYDPANDRWTAITLDDAPAGRGAHSAVWTGREVIVWGGHALEINPAPLSSGARWDAASERWLPLGERLEGGELPGRTQHAAVWTGREMLVWGGVAAGNTLPTRGLRFDPALNQWSLLAAEGSPAGASQGFAVWLGGEMLAWGARWGLYNPVQDSWRPVAATGRIAWNATTAGLSSGTQAWFWGGSPALAHRYDAATDTWAQLPRAGAPAARTGHALAWTGESLFIVGGADASVSNSQSLQRTLPRLGTTRPLYVYGKP